MRFCRLTQRYKIWRQNWHSTDYGMPSKVSALPPSFVSVCFLISLSVLWYMKYFIWLWTFFSSVHFRSGWRMAHIMNRVKSLDRAAATYDQLVRTAQRWHCQTRPSLHDCHALLSTTNRVLTEILCNVSYGNIVNSQKCVVISRKQYNIYLPDGGMPGRANAH